MRRQITVDRCLTPVNVIAGWLVLEGHRIMAVCPNPHDAERLAEALRLWEMLDGEEAVA
jgi:hypothetical protein